MCALCVCVFAVDSNPCQTNPCLHGGSCLQEGDGYSCYCPQGFSGESCEIGESLRKKKHPPQTKKKNSEVSSYRLLGHCSTREVWGGRGRDEHMLSSTLAHVLGDEFRGDLVGGKKSGGSFPM